MSTCPVFIFRWKPSSPWGRREKVPRRSAPGAEPGALGGSQGAAERIPTPPWTSWGPGFRSPVWKQGCWRDSLSRLSNPSFQGLGHTQYLFTQSLGITLLEKKTSWSGRDLLSIGSWVRALWGQRPGSVTFSPSSSTVHQAPSECWLKEWIDGIE